MLPVAPPRPAVIAAGRLDETGRAGHPGEVLRLDALPAPDVPLRCGFCHATEGGTVSCSACGVRLHLECWALVRCCPTLGCAAGVIRVTDRGAVVRVRGRGAGWPIACWAALLLWWAAGALLSLQPPRLLEQPLLVGAARQLASLPGALLLLGLLATTGWAWRAPRWRSWGRSLVTGLTVGLVLLVLPASVALLSLPHEPRAPLRGAGAIGLVGAR